MTKRHVVSVSISSQTSVVKWKWRSTKRDIYTFAVSLIVVQVWAILMPSSFSYLPDNSFNRDSTFTLLACSTLNLAPASTPTPQMHEHVHPPGPHHLFKSDKKITVKRNFITIRLFNVTFVHSWQLDIDIKLKCRLYFVFAASVIVMGKLLDVLFISKSFGTFSKPHKAAQLLFTCLTCQQATRDNRKTFLLKYVNKRHRRHFD